jgi:hypothetical protein
MTMVNIGQEAFSSQEIAIKIAADIQFLETRLQDLYKEEKPNPVILETYKDMLESRQALLEWLLQGQRKVSNS